MFGRAGQLVLFAVTSAALWFPRPSEVVEAAAPPASVSPSSASGALTLSTERIIVFKDGHGLFVKRATGVVGSDGTVFTDRVPDAAVLGTFWATAEGAELRSMSSGWYETFGSRTDESSCLTTLELLRANPGKAVTLGLAENREISGKIIEVLDAAPEKPNGPRLLAEARAQPDGVVEHEIAPRGGELVVIDGTERGRLVLPVGAIKTVAGKELGTHCRRAKESASRQKRLTFDLGRGAAGRTVSLRLFYFTPGIRWIPTYRVDTGAGAKAELSLQAELLNEEEDFENAAVDLVVGVPNFRFKDTVSPLSLEQALRSALAQAAPGLMNQQMMSNANFNLRSGERARAEEDDEGSAAMSSAPELSGERKQDLFVYPVKSLSLKKGARAAVPLWKSAVPQRHVYTVDLPLHRNGASTTSGDSRSPLKLVENQVWHQLELTDSSDTPWTTGAALLMQDGFPLGQDTLAYTSPGGRSTLPVTVAVDLRALHSEVEVERKPGALQIDGYSLALVKKRGTLTLTSHRKEKSVMRLSISTGGKVEQASDGATVKLDDQRSGDFADGRAVRANNHSDVSWELNLAPGETRTLTYSVSLYE